MNYAFFVILILFALVIFLLYRLITLTRLLKDLQIFLTELSKGNLNSRFFETKKSSLSSILKGIVRMMEKTKESLDLAEKEKERIEAILRGMSDAMLIIDKNGTIIFSNRPFNKLFSITESIENKRVMDVLRNIQITDIIKSVMDTWEVVSDELVITGSNNVESHFIATAVPIYSKDSISGAVLTLHDITRLKKLEEMRKDFVANVSHEIKTPITAIQGFTETLIDGAIDDKDNAMRFLMMIKAHSERLNRLVEDLLTLSKIEFGDILINKIDVDIKNVIDTVFMTLKEKADQKGLYLKSSIKDVETIYGDRDKLIQILLNLVENGIKFTETGGITVGTERQGFKSVLYVQDTGIGIPQKDISRLGERFYRVDRARSRELGGTGLGLAIVKHLVKAHKWDMNIESKVGVGTRINIICN